MRLSLPATTDYRVNDTKGGPLFVITAEANAIMTKMLPQILAQVRSFLGPRRRLTIVFDRGGWNPKLFANILTYRKGRVRRVSPKRFVLRKAEELHGILSP